MRPSGDNSEWCVMAHFGLGSMRSFEVHPVGVGQTREQKKMEVLCQLKLSL
jgi:hypothetical protein